jgi:hypothetical protein
MTSEVRTLGRRSDTFDMMRLCSRVRSRWKRNRAPRTSAAANGGLPAGNVEIVDLAADGGVESWSSPAGDEFHPVDPYLFELGWPAWSCRSRKTSSGVWDSRNRW